jgi:hypothetical protein
MNRKVVTAASTYRATFRAMLLCARIAMPTFTDLIMNAHIATADLIVVLTTRKYADKTFDRTLI